MRRHPVLVTGALLAVLALSAWGGREAWLWVDWSRWAAQASAAVATPSGHASVATLHFAWRGRTRFIDVPVEPAELAAARRLSTEGIFTKPPAVRSAYLHTVITTQSRSAAVTGMARQLRGLRDESRLDSDEYVELLARAVQDIPYGTPRASFDLPVEVAVDGRAVCSDKSVLLAALLLHEGYDTAVWTLDDYRHVAVGVRGLGQGFQGSGYAYVETTRRAYVGDVPGEFAGTLVGEVRPQLVLLSEGGRRYGADAQTELIVEALAGAERKARALEPYHAWAAAAGGQWQRYYAGMAREQSASSDLARRLLDGSDDRKRVYELLTR